MLVEVCFLGGARYSEPLDATSEKKFRALAALGHIFVIGFSKDAKPRRFTQHAHFYLLPYLPIPIVRYFLMFTFGPILALWCILRHKVSVLVAQSPYEGFAAALAKIIGGFLGRQVVLIMESHGDFEISLFLQRRILLPKVYRFLMRQTAHFALNHADLLRAVSNSTRAQLQKRASDKPLFQFMAWTDINVFFEAGRDEVYRQDILYAGVLIPIKGIHHLLNSFARIALDFPAVRLILIGREEKKAYAAQLKGQVERLGLNGRVQFVGEVPQTELAQWMQRSIVFVLPSLSEALGRVVVEAMATGTPVIGSRVGGIPEMVQDGINGFLFLPGDEVSLAERLRWVFEHPTEVREMGCRARTFAQRFFSTEAHVHGYLQVFQKAQAILETDGTSQ